MDCAYICLFQTHFVFNLRCPFTSKHVDNMTSSPRPEDSTLICPDNDLESHTILALGRELGLDVRPSKQGWGVSLDNEPLEALSHLKPTVVVVEMPGLATEQKLRELGHTMYCIDHHEYTSLGLDRRHPKSSLEQFADLFGITLTDEQRHIALFDQSGVNGLVEFTSLALNAMDKIARMDMEIQLQSSGQSPSEIEHIFSQSQNDFEKKIALPSHDKSGVPYIDQEFSPLFIIQTSLEKVGWIAHLSQRPTENTLEDCRRQSAQHRWEPRSVVILRTVSEEKGGQNGKQDGAENSTPRVVEVNFYGPWSMRDRLKERFDTKWSQYSDKCAIWSGGVEHLSMYCGGSSLTGQDIGWLADDILSNILDVRRPLDAFTTYFLFPFALAERINEDAQKSEWKIQDNVIPEEDVQYFHAHVSQGLLMNNKNSELIKRYACRKFEESDTKNSLRAVLVQEGDGRASHKKSISLSVKKVEMFLFDVFDDEIGILSLCIKQTLGADAEKDKKLQERPLWQKCLDIESYWEKGLTVGQALRINENVRRLYPSFQKQMDEGKIFAKLELLNGTNTIFVQDATRQPVNDPFKGLPESIVGHLVNSFLQGVDLNQLLDDRMVVHSFLSFAGPLPSSESAKLEHEAIFLRCMNVDIPGNGFEYDEDFSRKDAIQHKYTRWKHYGSVYGFTRYSSIFTGSGGAYANIVRKSFDSHYYFMIVLSLFYRSYLVYFSCLLAKISNENSQREVFMQIKEKFMKFSNKYWFDEITNQDQGIDIFCILKDAFLFDAMYEQIRDKIDRTEDLLRLRFEQDSLNFQNKVQKYGLALALLAILVGVMGMNPIILQGIAPFFTVVGLILALGFSVAFFVFALSKSKAANQKMKNLACCLLDKLRLHCSDKEQ